MASNNSIYGMGQLRYSGSNSDYFTIKKVNSGIAVEPASVSIVTDEENDQLSYKDWIIRLTNGDTFKTNVSYVLSLKIPKDPVYVCSYKLKIISYNDGQLLKDSLSYQLIRYISVPQQNYNNHYERAIVFKDPTETTTTDSSYKTDWAVDNINNIGDSRVLFENDKYYYISPDDNTKKEIQQFQDALLDPYWIRDDNLGLNREDNYAYYDIAFSLKTSSLMSPNAIWIQMVRNNFDYDIYNSKQSCYGRYIKLNPEDQRIRVLTNKINNTDPVWTHVGIYSHPGFIFTINNEDLKVGQSGYFELNDYEIKAIAFAPMYPDNDGRNMFTVDYQYKISD